MKQGPNLKFKLFTLLFLFTAWAAHAQSFTITGTVRGTDSIAITAATVTLKNASGIITVTTNSKGKFTFDGLGKGPYALGINIARYEPYTDSPILTGKNINLGTIQLKAVTHELQEVSIIEKVLAMVQKDDTLEFNSAAFKLSQDADATDLVKKLPSLTVYGNRITAQGEEVSKILIDGKPFFSNDPYATLKLLPAGIIAKVQVYNEKSEQEQFTGFSEGQTSKTINIVTKPNKRNGIFGKLYAGTGKDVTATRYGTGADLNRFNDNERITVTGHTDNLNAANFADPNPTANGGTGYTTTTGAAINYTNKTGEKTDWTGNYAFYRSGNQNQKTLAKTFTIPTGEGQLYREQNNSQIQSANHKVNLHIFGKIDSLTSLIISPQFSFQQTEGNTQRTGNTTDSLGALNETINNSNSHVRSYTLGGSLFYGHKFRKKGRTLSVNLNSGSNVNHSAILLKGNNTFFRSPLLSDTLNQLTDQNQSGSNYNGELNYTLPSGKHGQVRAVADVSYMPSKNEKNVYNYADGVYSLRDTLLSNALTNTAWNNKAGLSYWVHLKKYDFSVGANYQLVTLYGVNGAAASGYSARNFRNLLPTASYKYRFSRSSNIQVNYSTYTRVPTVTQLQNVVSNADPLHLVAGNPLLTQPYTHNLLVRYNFTGKAGKKSLNWLFGSYYTVNPISTNVIVAGKDTFLQQHILLPKGSQLTIPVNTLPSLQLTSNAGYSLPLTKIKCALSINISGDNNSTPAVINNIVNYQHRTNGSLSIAINSNISEKIDFSFTTAASVIASTNTLNRQANSTYYNQSGTGMLNLVLAHNILLNTNLSYQINYGLTAGYNQNYLVWNMSVGKKLFKKQQGDIRLTAIDLLNKNTNMQHIVTETYVQDSRSNILQRYVLLTFSYRIRDFN